MLNKEKAALLIIDIQGKLAEMVVESDTLFENVKKLIAGARLFQLPILYVEQYPQGLGPTKPELAKLLTEEKPIAKTTFSSMKNEMFRTTLQKLGRTQILITGIESHVCVYQTTCDLIAAGYEAHLVIDAVSSRTQKNRQLGIHRMEQAGASLTSTEMALFELMQEANTPLFREFIQLIK